MSAVYVVGVDPGDSTGVVALRDGVKVLAVQGAHAVALLRLSAFLAQVRYNEPNARVAIACERFVATSQRGARTHQPLPQQVIGEVQLLARSYDCEFVLQSPADAKLLAPNSRLTQLDVYTTRVEVGRPDANDVNDAARHAVLYLARHHAALFDHLLGTRPH